MSTEQSDFACLREELHRSGYDRKTTFLIVGEWLLFVFLFIGAITALIFGEAWWVKVLAMSLIILTSMGIATNAHTASHHAISNHKWVNDFFMYFGYPFFLQLSASYWRQKHLVIHHPNPNIIGIDNDANLAPFIALDQSELHRARGWHRWWYCHQGYFFPFLLAASAFAVVFRGWIFLVHKLADGKNRSESHWLDLGVLILHWIVWIFIPLQFFQALDVMCFTLARFGLISYVMFVLFAPAHYPASAVLLDKAVVGKNFLMLQTLTTINFRTGPLGRLLCGGVDFQIEHHLFPTISPRHYPEMSSIVKKFCTDHGYPYRSESWGKAILQSLLTFWRPKPIYSGLYSSISPHVATTERSSNLVVNGSTTR